MIDTLLRRLILLGLLVCPPALAAGPVSGDAPVPADVTAPTSDTQAHGQDIEHAIATLQDPEARAELVAQLQLLLEAQRRSGQSGEASPPPGPVDVVDTLRGLMGDLWEALTSIDPRQLLLSAGISLGIVIAALVIRILILRLLRRVFGRLTREASLDPDASGSEDRGGAGGGPHQAQLPANVTRLVNLVIAVLAIALIAESWGAGLAGLLQTDLGVRIAHSAVSIVVILILTMLAWNVSAPVVARVLALAAGRDDPVRSARRLDTLVPLLRSVLQVTIGVLAALLILSELGVNIGPLLAGAGILGLAVGFGAQTVVKDLITGVIILLEDSVGVGDVVDLSAGHVGVVEEMRIRIMQLRDLAGTVHLVPYSNVGAIKNMTKEFSFYLLEIGVAYREDTDEVCDVVRAIVDGMRDDEAYAPDILEPLQILGVDQFADSAVVIKARIKTQPGRQWAIGREFNRRMKKRFDEQGIEIPFPHTTLYFGEPKQGQAPPAHLVISQPPGNDS